MSTMQHMPMWQYIAVVIFTWVTGFLAGAALFYPTGRRDGIKALADYKTTSANARGDTE
jgi:hypothetical protein